MTNLLSADSQRQTWPSGLGARPHIPKAVMLPKDTVV